MKKVTGLYFCFLAGFLLLEICLSLSLILTGCYLLLGPLFLLKINAQKLTLKAYVQGLFWVGVICYLLLPFSPLSLIRLLEHIPLPLTVTNAFFYKRIFWLGLLGGLYLVGYYVCLRLLPSSNLQLLTEKNFLQQLRKNFDTSRSKHTFIFLILLFFSAVTFLGTTLAVSDLMVVGKVSALGYFVSVSVSKQILLLWLLHQRLSFETRTLNFKASLFFLTLAVCGSAFVTWQKLTLPREKIPLIISHRGVDGTDGVQNTIPALIKTHQRAHPAYVELDIQLTLDQHFVVSHDEDLRKLAKKELHINQSPLEELTKVQVFEHAKKAPLADFTLYLAKAQQLDQPLLIEFKLGNVPVSPYVTQFLTLYGKEIKKDQIHSMDLLAITTLKRSFSKASAGFILPFVLFGLPKNQADFYSVSAPTVTKEFITKAHKDHKKIYLWTLEQKKQALEAQTLGADAIITDEPSQIKASLQTATPVDHFKAKVRLLLKGAL